MTDRLPRLHDAVYKALHLPNKRSILNVFLAIEKAYGMVYRDALSLKLAPEKWLIS